jgi:anti-anti-sigma factor
VRACRGGRPPLSVVGGAAYRGGVRAQGALTEITGTGDAEHVCWVYDDAAVFDAAVHDFVARGLARGERLLCVGERVIASLREGCAPLADVDRLIADGVLETLTVAEAYDAAGEFVPERQLAFYDAATRRALADGYRGLRVVADVSPLAADPLRRRDLVRWEHLADHFVAHGPGMSALCAYRPDLGEEVLADAASGHPLVHTPAGLPPFRIFFDEGRLAVVGSVDTFAAERLARVLAATPVTGTTAILDLCQVDFVDVAGCRVIATWARELRKRSVQLTLLGASHLVQRMWQLLSLTEIAPVTFQEQAE